MYEKGVRIIRGDRNPVKLLFGHTPEACTEPVDFEHACFANRMALMDIHLWKAFLTDTACPPWPCPCCKAGVLTLSKGALKSKTTVASMADRNEDWWDSDHVVLSFTAWATCSNKLCAETFALAGDGGVEMVPDEDDNTDYANYFQLRYCHPLLELIAIPKNCPAPVSKALHAAFALYWIDRPSAAGRIRVALERLLDHLGVPAQTPGGKYVPLDTRVDQFSKTDPAHGAQLMALKWLGNVGSHTIDVNKDDLLAAFQVLEHALSELVEKKSAMIAKLAADMTAKYKAL